MQQWPSEFTFGLCSDKMLPNETLGRELRLEPQLVDLIVCAQGTKKEDKHLLTKTPREDKVVLGRVGKDAVDKVSNQLALVKHNTSLEKLMVKDREKEIERLHKEKGNLERKHG